MYFPFATVEHITTQFHLGCSLLRYWTPELPHWNWHTNSENKLLTIGRLQLTQHKQMIDFLFLESLFFSPTQALNTIWDQTLFARPVNCCNFWMNATPAYLFLICSTQQQTPISQTLSSHWQRCHCRRPDLSRITDTNVLTTWLNRTQIIPAKLTRSGNIHLDVSSSGQVPSALIHLKTTEDWGATDYKQSSVGSTNQSNTPKEFTSIQNGLNSFNSSH